MRRYILTAAYLLAGAASVFALSQAGSKTVWTGAYTEAQALRGLAVYRKACTYCHHDDLLGERT